MPLTLKRSARKDKIVEAAGRLFAYQGYHGTSTRQIARLANLSENTIFRYFDHKEDLFWSTLGAFCTSVGVRRDLLEGIANCEPPELVLPKILQLFADTARYRPELLRLLAVAFLEMHPKGEAFIQERFSPALMAICKYFESHIKGGRIRDLDPTTMTVALTMTALMHSEIAQLVDKNRPLLNHQVRNRAQARFWLDMLAPSVSAPVSPVGATVQD